MFGKKKALKPEQNPEHQAKQTLDQQEKTPQNESLPKPEETVQNEQQIQNPVKNQQEEVAQKAVQMLMQTTSPDMESAKPDIESIKNRMMVEPQPTFEKPQQVEQNIETQPVAQFGQAAQKQQSSEISIGKKSGIGQSKSSGQNSENQQKKQSEGKPALKSGQSSARSEEFFRMKAVIYNTLMETIDVGALASLEGSVAKQQLQPVIADVISLKNIKASISEQNMYIEDICNDILGYGPLEPLLARDDIADIMVNGYNSVFIEVGGKIEKTEIRFRSNQQLMNICQRIVSQVGRRVDESSPICDARLLDGSRVNVIGPPLAIDGPALTIRKFRKDKLTIDELVSFGSISPEGAKVLSIIGKTRCNIIISGGTGSGKTTLLNCMTGFIEEDERVITCEDAAELQLQQPHVVRLETRPPNLEGKGQITMTDLVKNCLRMRPERIIVGEVRGHEAFDLLQAMNTGHDGSMGTLHANSPREAISRMESMITMGGFNLPVKTIREMIVGSVDVIIQASRLRDGSRRITHITEVVGMEGDVPVTQDVFVYDMDGEDEDGRIIGKHRATGVVRPNFWERARYYGMEKELSKALDPGEIV